jgi:ATP-dependent Zn protease
MIRRANPRERTPREATAYHEAGHAVAAWTLGYRPTTATILAAGDSAGQVRHENPFPGISLEFDGSDRTRLRVERAIMICFAGPVAQKRYRPTSWRGWHGAADYATAAELAFRVCGSREIASAFLKWLDLRAGSLIADHWDAVERVAAALLERGALGHEEIASLMAARSTAPDTSRTRATSC